MTFLQSAYGTYRGVTSDRQPRTEHDRIRGEHLVFKLLLHLNIKWVCNRCLLELSSATSLWGRLVRVRVRVRVGFALGQVELTASKLFKGSALGGTLVLASSCSVRMFCFCCVFWGLARPRYSLDYCGRGCGCM